MFKVTLSQEDKWTLRFSSYFPAFYVKTKMRLKIERGE